MKFYVLTAVTLAMLAGIGASQRDMNPIVGWSERVPKVAGVRHYYVAPEGKAENPGTRDAPWDLASALAGQHKVAPGDVIWVRGGTYKGPKNLEVKLAGREGAPIIVRGYPGERATILDTELLVVPSADYVWLWDLEIMGSATVEKRETKQTGSWPTDLPGGNGLTVNAGKGCKYIDLVIHDNVGGGVGFWVDATDSEFHGCLVYNNGWRAPDRGHGHCFYIQNKDGVKTISNCIMSVPYEGSYTMHCYGTRRAFLDNFLLEDNVAFERGPFLVGGGCPSHHIRVFRNYLYGVDMWLGYGAQNADCEVRDNIIAKGRLTIQKFEKVMESGNLLQLPDRKVILIPNKYDPNRAHLVVYNGAKAAEVTAEVAPFLKPGASFRLLNPKDFYGKPVLEGRCRGGKIAIPMTGEFAAFIIVKR